MKFLLHGNAPWVKTGYGVQLGMLGDRLAALYGPENVRFSATYGLAGSMMSWHGMEVYPQGYEVNSNDLVNGHATQFFQGDPSQGWIITCIDVWSLANPQLADFQIAAWVPVDHHPVPESVLRFFHRTGAVPVAMARHGADQLRAWGLDPVHIPLAVDTKAYKPTATVTIGERTVTARQVFINDVYPHGLPADAFVVGMVAMNKTWSHDRKGFNEAFRAFGAFWQEHQDAILLVHSEKHGQAEGHNLLSLAEHCGIPEHAVVFTDQYAYKLGLPSDLMAALYSAIDVLLAPSHGEGFCVPLIEAQACGTVVIASDFTAQTELVADPIRLVTTVDEGLTIRGETDYTTGWLVDGQLSYDPTVRSEFLTPFTHSVYYALVEAFKADRQKMGARAIAWAARWDVDAVFEEHWKPFLATLEPPPPPEPKDPIPEGEGAVAVIVPVVNRPQNVVPLSRSLWATTDEANLYFVADCDDLEEIAAIERSGDRLLLYPNEAGVPGTYAEKANFAFSQTSEPWVLVVGDDVEFHDGWIGACRAVSATADVVGTNDSLPGRVRNPEVAAGRHADHFLIRRDYVEEEGSSLDGPGVLMPEVYGHWHVDLEVVGLAKARGVFTPCLEAVVEHHHPGYDGREDLRQADATYMRAVECSEQDRKTWLSRLPLIEMQRTTRAR